ncbi:MAG: transposase [Clostridia bacterium]|nr:transposase [Clostridia bacterium]
MGRIVARQIDRWNQTYPDVWIEQYVIMPNHLHLIICIDHGILDNDRTQTDAKAATVSRMVKQFKGAVTKHAGQAIWQRSFHDHIIRTQADNERIATYIQNNPYTWMNDCFYAE